jgi:hypothetical protein
MFQKVAQSAGTMPNEMGVTSSNPPPPSCANMSKIYIYILLLDIIAQFNITLWRVVDLEQYVVQCCKLSSFCISSLFCNYALFTIFNNLAV